MKYKGESHQNPRQVRGREDKEPQEGQARVRVAARPDVDKGRG